MGFPHTLLEIVSNSSKPTYRHHSYNAQNKLSIQCNHCIAARALVLELIESGIYLVLASAPNMTAFGLLSRCRISAVPGANTGYVRWYSMIIE